MVFDGWRKLYSSGIKTQVHHYCKWISMKKKKNNEGGGGRWIRSQYLSTKSYVNNYRQNLSTKKFVDKPTNIIDEILVLSVEVN